MSEKPEKMVKTADHERILDTLAPCGLNCLKCFAHAKGEIRLLSSKLKRSLGAFDRYAERFSKFLPVFRNYLLFKEFLSYLAQGDCLGCRRGTCRYPNCGVISCSQQMRVDFCCQCPKFPCEKTNFDPDLKRRWIEMNERMKEIGIEAYYQESRDLPRYR